MHAPPQPLGQSCATLDADALHNYLREEELIGGYKTAQAEQAQLDNFYYYNTEDEVNYLLRTLRAML